MAHIYRERRSEEDDPAIAWRGAAGAGAGECVPPMDVVESASGVELLMDLPGVPSSAVHIVFSQGTLVISGRKTPGVCPHAHAAFHLAERSFGGFVRAVRLTGAFDAGHATATLSAGELRVFLPRIDERRGRDIPIAISGRG